MAYPVSTSANIPFTRDPSTSGLILIQTTVYSKAPGLAQKLKAEDKYISAEPFWRCNFKNLLLPSSFWPGYLIVLLNLQPVTLFPLCLLSMKIVFIIIGLTTVVLFILVSLPLA